MAGRSGSGPTARDVARTSGVSATTVSFVLNDTPGQTIPEATRERVRRAADELGYPLALTRALREGATRTVVVAMGGLPGGRALESFIAGLDAELAQHDYSVVVLPSSGPAIERTIDAISPKAVIDLGAVYSTADGDGRDGGWIDGLASHSFIQLQHLTDAGHRSIAFAVPAGPGAHAAMIGLRSRHLREAATVLGVPSPMQLELPDEAGPAKAALADAIGHGVTAVAGFDDDSAARALSAARSLARRVPGELAVIGFDDAGWGQHTTPTLTSVRIEAVDYGRRAARRILGLPETGIASPHSWVLSRESA